MTAKTQTFDINQWIEQLKKCEYIKESEVKALCTRAKEILLEESNVQHVESPVTVSLNLLNFPTWNKWENSNAYSFIDLWRYPWLVL